MAIKFFLLLLAFVFCEASQISPSRSYNFFNDPIDVVIPSTEKDLDTLDMCIEGIRENGQNIRRIIVVSKNRLTDNAEWFPESEFPFTKKDVAYELNKRSNKRANEYLENPQNRAGWYLQQLLKLYAQRVIPGLSSNLLILDSDTIFLNPVSFTDENNQGLYNPGSEYHLPYFEFTKRFLPSITRIWPNYSGISHHMLFQRSVLDDLFRKVEKYHKTDLWKAFCRSVSSSELLYSGASEYEVYFNFVFKETSQVKLRFLTWENLSDLSLIGHYKQLGYHYVSCHAYMRNP